MRTIHKYTFNWEVGATVQMPEGAQIIDCQVQNHKICIWAIVDTDKPMQPTGVHVAGTGHELPESCTKSTHISTLQYGSLVWHVFIIN